MNEPGRSERYRGNADSKRTILEIGRERVARARDNATAAFRRAVPPLPARYRMPVDFEAEPVPGSDDRSTENGTDNALSQRMTEDSQASIDSTSDPQTIYDALRTEIERILVGNEEAVELLTIALLTREHLLLEGVPGVAKTTLANLFARASGLEYNRLQMTPDVLPADITGTQVYREYTGEFELQRGPIFTNLLVADEINRATPKAQSALLEAMQERQVTIEGKTLDLPAPFMVIATQNPIEMEGVYELPEAQRDRFQFKHTIELPDRVDERELIERFNDDLELDPESINQVVRAESLLRARKSVADVYVAPPIKDYLLDLVTETRDHPDIAHGASPRATLTFLSALKARAAIHGREYAIPDDVKALAEPILNHRIVLATDAELSDASPEEIIGEIVDSVDLPAIDVSSEVETAAMSDGGDVDSEEERE